MILLAFAFVILDGTIVFIVVLGFKLLIWCEGVVVIVDACFFSRDGWAGIRQVAADPDVVVVVVVVFVGVYLRSLVGWFSFDVRVLADSRKKNKYKTFGTNWFKLYLFSWSLINKYFQLMGLSCCKVTTTNAR